MIDAKTAPRSLTIDVYPSADHLPAVRSAIAKYRAACRHMYAVFACVQAAGAELIDADGDVSLKPNNNRARDVLIAAMGHEGPAKAPVYPCRRWFLDTLYPGCMSFVWDSARTDVWDRWSAKDPEFTRAGRGWLTLQGARGVAEFRGIGIKFPQSSARPTLTNHGAVLKWDHAIGPVAFGTGNLDARRYMVFENLRSGDWKSGTFSLGERDGRIRLTMTYHQPVADGGLDPARQMIVGVDGDSLVMTGPGGSIEAVPLADPIGQFTRLRIQREIWEKRRAGCGSVTRSWGFRRAWRDVQKHLDRVTLRRTRVMTDWNHAISRRVASLATIWRCGAVSIKWPNEIGGNSWARDELIRCCRYKLDAIGGVLAVIDEPSDKTKNQNGAPPVPRAGP